MYLQLIQIVMTIQYGRGADCLVAGVFQDKATTQLINDKRSA